MDNRICPIILLAQCVGVTSSKPEKPHCIEHECQWWGVVKRATNNYANPAQYNCLLVHRNKS